MRSPILTTVALFICCLTAATVTRADVPFLINLQGILTDSLGNPISSQTSANFSIFGQEVGGFVLWSETRPVDPDGDGLFSVLLGEVNAIPDTVFAGATRFVEIWIPPAAPLTPRIRLSSVGYAYRVSSIDGALAGQLTGDLEVLGNVTLGHSNTNTGGGAMVFGNANTGSALNATVGGGRFSEASGASSTVAGGAFNTAEATGAVVSGGGFNRAAGYYSVVGGGGGAGVEDSNSASAEYSVVSGGRRNYATGDRSYVGGGYNNEAAGSHSTVGGGRIHFASGAYATVGGGWRDTATGDYATVPGGALNSAVGNYSFAAGRRARSTQPGGFTWADSVDQDFSNGIVNYFRVRCTGGAEFVSSVNSSGFPNASVYLLPGSTSWSTGCDRNLKENFEAIDGAELLERISELPVHSWNYKAQDDSIRHVGPVAQDFYRLFGVGEGEKHISTVDADGVALAAIQALYEKTREIDRLEARLAELEGRLEEMSAE